MTHLRDLPPGPTELDQTWGTRPGFYAVFMSDYNRSLERVDPTLIELCRLRMATLVDSALDLSLRYQPAIGAGLTEAKIRALPQCATSPLFTQRERVCLEFAELFVIQSSSIGDEDVARVQTVLAPDEFIYFVKALSVIDQLQRSCAAFDVRPNDRVPPTLGNFRLLEPATA